MLSQTTATASSFFMRWRPLTANILTVAFVYCFVKITQKELRGEEVGRLTYLWLIVMVSSFLLYELYHFEDACGQATLSLCIYRSWD